GPLSHICNGTSDSGLLCPFSFLVLLYIVYSVIYGLGHQTSDGNGRFTTTFNIEAILWYLLVINVYLGHSDQVMYFYYASVICNCYIRLPFDAAAVFCNQCIIECEWKTLYEYERR
ncbi:unnamed protein product, partial [Meganyctiphanes norvegica]